MIILARVFKSAALQTITTCSVYLTRVLSSFPLNACLQLHAMQWIICRKNKILTCRSFETRQDRTSVMRSSIARPEQVCEMCPVLYGFQFYVYDFNKTLPLTFSIFEIILKVSLDFLLLSCFLEENYIRIFGL